MTTEHPYAVRHRTHLAGSLRATDAGVHVRLGGWVHRRRAMGGIVFIDLRDRAGIVQVSFDPRSAGQEMIDAAAALGAETVVLVEGDVVARPENMRNPDLPTGEVEVRATSVRVVGPASTPVIPVARGKGEVLPAEELRLRHRHLDLRRPELQRNIILRHRLMQATRRYFDALGFLEVETPILTKPTPEGARDYLVPSRVHPGEFYALPQSPQLYKQLLMISGFDRYFQIARCFRDEDLRADRQPEFTQIDVEAAFVGAEDIMNAAEGLVQALWREGGHEVDLPFPRMKYAEAMERYGSDKPDLRFGLEIDDFTDAFRDAEFSITRDTIARAVGCAGFVCPAAQRCHESRSTKSRRRRRRSARRGLLRLKRQGGPLEGPAAKFLSADAVEKLAVGDGDFLLLVAGPDHVTSPSLDRVRHEVATRMALIPAGTSSFLWVVDFPLFIRDPKTGELQSVNHPFTAPHPDDEHLLDKAPERVRSLAYDVILNGTELGGGSIRIGDPRLQSRVFHLLGLDEQTAEARFGFLLEALRAGAPPHGGIAFGFDRITMLLAGAESLRDVIAFPKTTKAAALFEGAPVAVRPEELRELHISLEGGAV